MLKYQLPLRAFELFTENTLEASINADDEGDMGYVVEIDLEYPDELHQEHSHFPLISDKQPIYPLELSEHQTEMKNALKITTARTEKLRQTFHNKKHCVVHYRNLKFFVEQGINVTKTYHAIKFSQSKWLAKYVDLNTTKRQEALSKLHQDLFKLMSNSTFRKLCESLRNRVAVAFIRTEELLKATSEGNFKSVKIIDEKLLLITKKKQSMMWNKPTIVGHA